MIPIHAIDHDTTLWFCIVVALITLLICHFFPRRYSLRVDRGYRLRLLVIAPQKFEMPLPYLRRLQLREGICQCERALTVQS